MVTTRRPAICVSFFIIALEVLLIHIRNDSSVSGIKIGSDEIKPCVFADDLTCLLKDKPSYTILQQTVHRFSFCSRLKLNKEKTEVFWLGSKRNNPDNLPDLKFKNKPIKILGIYFTYNEQKRRELYFKLVIRDLRKLFASTRRPLKKLIASSMTLFGTVKIR